MASTISLQGTGELLPETAGQQVVLLISGTDFYGILDLRMKINDGLSPAPEAESVFNSTGGSIPRANLEGSVWAGGNGGWGAAVDGTRPGLYLAASFGVAFYERNTAGIVLVLSITTVGVPTGQYALSFENSELVRIDQESLEPIQVPLQFESIQLSIVPEPSTHVMAAMGIFALVFARRGKR